MFILLIIFLVIGCCGSFCYLFYKILEINKDIDSLYDNYCQYIEGSIKNSVKRSNVLK